jgi:hypothetical protein
MNWHENPGQVSLSLVIALLGPGAYSLDARLFGLRRIEIAPLFTTEGKLALG